MTDVTTAPPETARAAAISAAKAEAGDYLRSLLNKNLVITTTDSRKFRGAFMCTDPDRNIVLAQAEEFQEPTARQREKQIQKARAAGQTGSIVFNMRSRFLGQIVVPGQHIISIEVEEFASQMRK